MMETTAKADEHTGLVHVGKRYSAYFFGLGNESCIEIHRNSIDTNTTNLDGERRAPLKQLSRDVPQTIFGLRYAVTYRSMIEMVEEAVALIEEYDSVLDQYSLADV